LLPKTPKPRGNHPFVFNYYIFNRASLFVSYINRASLLLIVKK